MSWPNDLHNVPANTQPYSPYSPYSHQLANTDTSFHSLPSFSSRDVSYANPPRMTSPRLFRATLFPSIPYDSRGLPGLPIPNAATVESSDQVNYNNTLRNVQSALLNADMALRNAEAAFRHGRTTRSSFTNVIDLTRSDDHEADGALQTGDNSSFDVESEEGDQYDGPHPTRIPSIHSLLLPGGPQAREAISQADRSAVRRQRQARIEWSRVERRNRERAQQYTQNQTAAATRLQEDQRSNEGSITHSQPTVARPVRSRRQSSASNTPSARAPSVTSIASSSEPEHAKSETQSEAIDLTQVSDAAAVFAKEQQAAIAAQPKPPVVSASASSLSNYKCAICMDSPTNATTTICGHLFCHRCILDSLKWSERQRHEDAMAPRGANGLCPVCRKALKNKEVSVTAKTAAGGLVNLEFKKISRKDYNNNKEREQFLASLGTDKGKQRAVTDDITDIDGIVGWSNSDADSHSPRGSIAAQNARKRKRERPSAT